MPQPDLLERARAAVTVEEECDVIDDAIDALRTGHPDLNALAGTVARVRIGECPRPVLLGVVAALVPEGRIWSACGYNDKGGSAAMSRNWPNSPDAQTVATSAASPALALLIAIREASNG